MVAEPPFRRPFHRPACLPALINSHNPHQRPAENLLHNTSHHPPPLMVNQTPIPNQLPHPLPNLLKPLTGLRMSLTP